MTVSQCRAKNGQNERLCKALIKAGLKLSEISDDWQILHRGFTAREDAALQKYYRTPLPEIPECSPDCVMCHPELLRKQ